ncbi:inducible metalloproteinase inhibitor protein-like [Vespula squamosa]|uniref:Inducible metalloproteinase inhibitor protein-like n=1 Tax=Vespula squamosa TaxID=30214 RepID=A0ABD2AHS1_VESSQ
MSRILSISFILLTMTLLAIVNITYSKNISCNGPNEIYACGSACQTKCETLGEPCPIINIKCNDGCYCIENYARNCDNLCIPISECPHRIIIK